MRASTTTQHSMITRQADTFPFIPLSILFPRPRQGAEQTPPAFHTALASILAPAIFFYNHPLIKPPFINLRSDWRDRNAAFGLVAAVVSGIGGAAYKGLWTWWWDADVGRKGGTAIEKTKSEERPEVKAEEATSKIVQSTEQESRAARVDVAESATGIAAKGTAQENRLPRTDAEKLF